MGPVEEIYKEGKVKLYHSKVDKYTSLVDLKAFYNELHDFLVNEDWGDFLTPGFDTQRGKEFGGGNVLVKKGEFTDAGDYRNRTRDMFETHFMFSDKGNGGKEFELKWDAVTNLPLSHFSSARVIFKLNVVNRFMPDKEVEIDGKKVTMQGGTWEFRNELIYVNTIRQDNIDKLPILGKWNWTKELYYSKFYVKYVENDINYILGTVRAKIYAIINKHFSLRSS